MPIDVEVCLVTYANPARLQAILAYGAPHAIVEDLSTPELSTQLQAIATKAHVPSYRQNPIWGGLQGAGQFMMEQSTADWVIYWPDDAVPTPGSVEQLTLWCQRVPDHVGALQWPYWNLPDVLLFDSACPKTGMFDPAFPAWLRTVPLNPHWFGPAFYINLNGAGFALRRAAWLEVGGFSPETWCLDEDISVKLWRSGKWTVMTVPGPPLIHHGGMSTPDQHQHGHAHNRASTIEGWHDAWHGQGKDELAALCRVRMAEWQAKTGFLAR